MERGETENRFLGLQGEKMGTEENRTLVFTYGTLKQGFANHGLIQEMDRTGNAEYLGSYRTVERYPLVCGPYGIPYLLNIPNCGDRVWGELYAVTGHGLAQMDELEGTSTGHYERLPAEVVLAEAADGNEKREAVVGAEVYFAHRSFAEELWRRNGEKGFCRYSEKEAEGFVKREDRPQNINFPEQVRLFCSTSPMDDRSLKEVIL